ncbi:MAG: hypothetical protein AAFX06_29180 [Planctomycetota bacterium]
MQRRSKVRVQVPERRHSKVLEREPVHSKAPVLVPEHSMVLEQVPEHSTVPEQACSTVPELVRSKSVPEHSSFGEP